MKVSKSVLVILIGIVLAGNVIAQDKTTGGC